jgi:hypothetical protein
MLDGNPICRYYSHGCGIRKHFLSSRNGYISGIQNNRQEEWRFDEGLKKSGLQKERIEYGLFELWS